MDTWVSSSLTGKGYSEFSVSVNDKALKDATLKSSVSTWEGVPLTDRKGDFVRIPLKAGVNTISLSSSLLLPNVEFIKLSLNEANRGISDEGFKKRLEEIAFEREHSIPFIVDPTSSIHRDSQPPLKSVGAEEYSFTFNQPLLYSTYVDYYFSAGENVEVVTSNGGAYEHVIHLFSKSYPASYTWTQMVYSKDRGTLGGTLSALIPVTGIYRIFLRSYRQFSSGTVTLTIKVNGTTISIQTNAPISGGGIRVTNKGTSINNYFTCKLSPSGADTYLWLEDDTNLPGNIIAYNDSYSGTGDFNWGWASRIKTNLTNVAAGLVSSYSSYVPLGSTFDLYLGIREGDIMSYFPNLKADDAIRSAPSSSTYNCISWTINRINYWEWPLNPSSSYYNADPLKAFDLCYTSNGYTRTGADSLNAAVALWALSGSFTHGSITKNTYLPNVPHGYDWESKPGSLSRTLHPRHALNGSSYGSILYYYKPQYT
ncbi:MAG: hypothetical protein LBU03_06050 [Tannerellaceae bacterium]|nr:hypothetical protein [Tannerellaceae bacterium]